MQSAEARDGQPDVMLGLALAYLGRKGEAVREGERSVALVPIAKEPMTGPYVQTTSCGSTSSWEITRRRSTSWSR